ncbi:unnamed protein product [Symbiodinium natans]|uniref:Uncharacterized protein n=1 Tax=Symbiodinium natans TaxID=878477 RepID=A0A812RWG9_9DINO|nr:unnamed protein product [Symbiodinium natans]
MGAEAGYYNVAVERLWSTVENKVAEQDAEQAVLFGAYIAVAHRWLDRQHLMLAIIAGGPDLSGVVPLLVAALTASCLAFFRSAKRRLPASKQEEDVDPIWMADWTNREDLTDVCSDVIFGLPKQLASTNQPCVASVEREEVAKKLQKAEPPRKVFDLNDTPTWLAQMHKRKEQAQRAGKDKLVQKLDKEIEQATRSKSLTVTKGPELRAGREAAEAAHEDDVWSMDWSNWRSFESAPAAVAAA